MIHPPAITPPFADDVASTKYQLHALHATAQTKARLSLHLKPSAINAVSKSAVTVNAMKLMCIVVQRVFIHVFSFRFFVMHAVTAWLFL